MDFGEEHLTDDNRDEKQRWTLEWPSYFVYRGAKRQTARNSFEDHENRIRKLETFSTKVAGGLAVVAVGASWLFSKITTGGGG